MFYKSTFYESALYDFIFRQTKSPTLHVLRACVLHSLLSSHHALRLNASAKSMLLDIKFMFCSVHDFWVLHMSVHCPCFTNPRFTNLRYTTSFFVNRSLFTSLRFAQSSFELPRFTSPHFGIVHVLDTKFMFCNVHDFWVLFKSALQIHILRILLQSETSTLDVLRVYLCTVHFLKTTFYDSTLQTCSYKSVLQLYSLNMYVLQSPFLFYKCNVFTKFPLYDCYPDNVYPSPCFFRLPFTCPRLSRFAHAVQILHS